MAQSARRPLGARQAAALQAAQILSAVGSLTWLLLALARAAEPQPDKSGYSIFNPTPTDAMRSFSTDRPTRANVPWTVDAGHYQIETDLGIYSYNHARTPPVNTRTWTVLDPTLKAGLTDRVELDLFFTGLYSNIHAHDRATGATQQIEGYGDMTLRSKINLWGNEGGASAFTLIPLVKFPTNSGGVGNDATEYGVIAPLALSAPYDVTVLLIPEFDSLRNSSNASHHGHYAQVVNLSRKIIGEVTGFVEFYADAGTERGEKTFYTLDLAAAWVVMPNLQLDIGSNIGLNDAAPTIQAYIGLSARF
jgi:hypothetical protein